MKPPSRPSRPSARAIDASQQPTLAATVRKRPPPSAPLSQARRRPPPPPPQGTPSINRLLNAAAQRDLSPSTEDDSEAAERLEEYTEGEEESLDEPDNEVQLPERSSMRYDAIWLVSGQYKKEKLERRSRKELLYSNSSAFEQAKAWMRPLSEGWKHVQTTASLSHAKLKPSEAFVTDIETEEDYQGLVERAYNWFIDGLVESRIELVFKCQKDDQPAPQASQAVAGSATQRQLARVDEVVAELEAGGDISHPLRVEWPCSQQSCQNNNQWKHCYWIGCDTADNHFPLDREVTTLWTKEIKAGRATYRTPSSVVWPLLSKARENMNKKRHKKKIDNIQQPIESSNNPITINQFFSSGIYQLPNTTASIIASAPPLQGEPPSSQPSETPPLTVFKAFFR